MHNLDTPCTKILDLVSSNTMTISHHKLCTSCTNVQLISQLLSL